MPTTRSGSRRPGVRGRGRAGRPGVSSTSTAVPPSGGPGGEVGGGPGGQGGGHEVVAVALGHHRHEQLAAGHGPGVDGGARRPPRRARRAGRRSAAATSPTRSRTAGTVPHVARRPAPRVRSSRPAVPEPLPPRVRLVVLFGGRSAEHEVSCVSAASVLGAVDPGRYDVDAGRHHPRRPLGAGRRRPAAVAAPAPPPCRPLPVAGPEVDPLTGAAAPRAGRATTPWSCCPCCTAPWARTAPCRACSSWPACPTWAPACSARRLHGQGGGQGGAGPPRPPPGPVARPPRRRRRPRPVAEVEAELGLAGVREARQPRARRSGSPRSTRPADAGRPRSSWPAPTTSGSSSRRR